MKSEVCQKTQESNETLAPNCLYCIVNELAEQGQHNLHAIFSPNRGHYCLSNAVQHCIFGQTILLVGCGLFDVELTCVKSNTPT